MAFLGFNYLNLPIEIKTEKMAHPAKVTDILINLGGAGKAVGEIIHFALYPASKRADDDTSRKHNADHKANGEKPVLAVLGWWWYLLLLLRRVSIVDGSPLEIALHDRIHAPVCLLLFLLVLIEEIICYLPLRWSWQFCHSARRRKRWC